MKVVNMPFDSAARPGLRSGPGRPILVSAVSCRIARGFFKSSATEIIHLRIRLPKKKKREREEESERRKNVLKLNYELSRFRVVVCRHVLAEQVGGYI